MIKLDIRSMLMALCAFGIVLHTAFNAVDAAEETPEEAATGPHGGRLLSDGDFAVELAIFEDGVPPEYRAWAYSGGELLPVSAWQLSVQLTRLGGARDDFTFGPAGEFLRGQQEVEEPHSFDVSVAATHEGARHAWQYPSYEGRVTLAPALAEELQVSTAIAGSATLHQTVLLYGRTTPDPQGVSHVTARYPGLIRSINADLGERVEAGASHDH